MRKVLIIEDDTAMAVALRDGFEYEGYDVTVAKEGAAGLRLATEGRPDLVILDVMLPKINGLEVCRQIRKQGNSVPIIMLTARGQEIDKVRGLRIGADDYVTKPFGFLELMARVEALLRRASGPGAAPVDAYQFGEVTVNFMKLEAKKRGRPIDLSPREFKLLKFLIEHRGQVVARDQLLGAVWGYEGSSFTRTVDMHIAKLRKKIEDAPADPRHIVTVHGFGYRFNE
jgi:DNA-binding response OmpR family regulator